eukprot:768368-Hanusia_phi.AAC.2
MRKRWRREDDAGRRSRLKGRTTLYLRSEQLSTLFPHAGVGGLVPSLLSVSPPQQISSSPARGPGAGRVRDFPAQKLPEDHTVGPDVCRRVVVLTVENLKQHEAIGVGAGGGGGEGEGGGEQEKSRGGSASTDLRCCPLGRPAEGHGVLHLQSRGVRSWRRERDGRSWVLKDGRKRIGKEDRRRG